MITFFNHCLLTPFFVISLTACAIVMDDHVPLLKELCLQSLVSSARASYIKWTHSNDDWDDYWKRVKFLPDSLKSLLLDRLSVTHGLMHEECLSYIVHNGITHLNLFNYSKGDTTLKFIRNTCPSLVSVNLGGKLPHLNMFSTSKLVNFFSSYSTLEEVSLENVIFVDASVVYALVKNNHQTLQVLNLRGCPAVCHVCICHLVICSQLRVLNLSRTPVSDSAIMDSEEVWTSLLCLEEVILDGCSLLTSKSTDWLKRRCPSLRSLSFRGTRAALDALVNSNELVLNRAQI